jgi:hypothetical protein
MAVNPIAANTQANGYFLNCEKVARVPLFRNVGFSPPIGERQIKDFSRALPGRRYFGSLLRRLNSSYHF